MRQEAEWMVPSDDKILELIREYGNLTPTAIEDLGGPSAGHARNRCPVLAKYGLVDRISRGLYGITEEGEAYLNEELDASELKQNEDTQ
ncbi:winged helix-turn-helix domain-containing protein [Natronorubrum daqingense]|nr:winged helix-turn-helix domain-containing protein [Natronorubrum daqingense]